VLWVVVWVVLVLAGAAVIGRLGYQVFLKAVALLTELGRAGDLVAEVSEQARRAAADRARRDASDAAPAVTPRDRTPLSGGGPKMAVPASERL
jgi:hypothetical protein